MPGYLNLYNILLINVLSYRISRSTAISSKFVKLLDNTPAGFSSEFTMPKPRKFIKINNINAKVTSGTDVRTTDSMPVARSRRSVSDRVCVASPTSGQNVSTNMRDFDLPQETCNGDKVHGQT